MQTRPVTSADLARSVIAVPPMARDKDLKFDRAENEKILRHIEAGNVTTMLYGGNANFYHLAPSEYESVLGQLAEIAAPDTLVIPSAGPSYGVMMDQAAILKGTDYPTVMVLPHQGITTSDGVVAGLRNFAKKAGKPIVLYIKYGDYISVEGAKELVEEGLVSWIKYAIVREDTANDIGEQPVIEHLVDFGVNGFTAGCVCVRPDLSDQLLKAVQAGDLDRAREIQTIFKPLENLRNRINPIRVLHEAVRLAGIAETGPALPLLSGITAEQADEVKAVALTLLHAKV